jgi:fluoroquinolone resistance protein
MNQRKYTEGRHFERCIDHENPLLEGDYENCRFFGCDFSAASLSDINFTDCIFSDCNFSMAEVRKTVFNSVRFIECKLLGIHFEDCHPVPFNVEFERCTLDYASFVKCSLRKTKFTNCNLLEVDFTESDLQEAVFENCDLLKTIFERTNLEKTDFRTSIRFSIDPDLNRMKRARFSSEGLEGLLYKYGLQID